MIKRCAATQNTEMHPSLEEYVIVPQPDEIGNNNASSGGHDESEINDDDSYDYCEDVFSQGEQFADSDDDDDSVASRLCDNKDSIIISVPSGLMKDLDEAHAAAALARVSDVSEMVESASVSTKDTPVQEPEESDDASIQKTSMDDTRPSEAPKTNEQADSKAAAAAAAIAANNLSRASNKKRRKKLKLMKKAQAAANAAEALAARTAAMSKIHQAKKIIPASTSRTTSRKVANIAVACARETMATYRQEVLCSSLS